MIATGVRLGAGSDAPTETWIWLGRLHGTGLTGSGGNGNGAAAPNGGGNLAEQMLHSALQYRAQAPLVDGLLKELGVTEQGLPGLLKEATDADLDLDEVLVPPAEASESGTSGESSEQIEPAAAPAPSVSE